MSETQQTNGHGIDPKTESKANYGTDARRKVMLTNCKAPLHVLAAHGIEVPHRDFDTENARPYPTTVAFEDGTRVHLHQDVREDMDDAFGSFGAIEDEMDDDVVWTVVDLCDGTVTLTVVGEWNRRRDVPFEEFPADYEPLTLSDGAPQFGY